MPKPRVSAGGGFAALAYTWKKGREAGGVWKLYRRMRTRNACKTCAYGMGGQNGGAISATGPRDVEVSTNVRKMVQKKLSSGELHPLLISFDTPKCVFPLGISAVGGKPSQVSLYVLSAEPLLNRSFFDEAQEKVRTDLNTARLNYVDKLEHIRQAAEFTTARLFMADIINGYVRPDYVNELIRFKESEELDILTITDETGRVILRTSHPSYNGDDQSSDEIVSAVIRDKVAVVGTTIISADELLKESPDPQNPFNSLIPASFA